MDRARKAFKYSQYIIIGYSKVKVNQTPFPSNTAKQPPMRGDFNLLWSLDLESKKRTF